MTKKPLSPPRSSSARTAATSARRASDEWFANWTGMRWMNLSLQVWTIWIRQCSVALQPWNNGVPWSTGADSADDDRRHAGLSWLPRVESSVVPFRRRDDPPGTEAEKLSMRIQVPPMPWESGGGSVIAIDSLRPRRVEPTGGKSPTRH